MKVPADSTPAVRRPAPRVVAAPAPKKERTAAAISEPIAVPAPPSANESIPAFTAPALATTDENGWFTLAEDYLRQGDEKRAEALYRRILGEGTQQGRAALALGDLFARKNDYSRAQEFYRTSTRLFQYSAQQASTP